jgi:hypothetical protein
VKLKEIPPFCLAKALVSLLMGRLRFLTQFRNTCIKMPDGSIFRIFRNIGTNPVKSGRDHCVFIVSFKFSRLSHNANRVASVIPMMIIAGFPGFVQKIYAVNDHNGYWQGMYEWSSEEHLARYQRSLVFRVMNKRAIPGSIRSMVFQEQELRTFVKNHLCEPDTVKN